jgi:dienelactone hydrolase
MHGQRWLRAVIAAPSALLLTACIGMKHLPLDEAAMVVPDTGWVLDALFEVPEGPIETYPSELEATRPDVGSHPLKFFSSLFADSYFDSALDGYAVEDLYLESVGDNAQSGGRVNFRYYRSELPGRHPTVLILPIWAGWEYPPAKLAWHIRDATGGAINIVLMIGESELLDWPRLEAVRDEAQLRLWSADMAERYRVTMVDVRRLTDWIAARPEGDPTRIGLAGFSIGALMAGTVLVMDERFAATAVVMGAARPGAIIASCDGDTATAREAVLQRLDWTAERFEALMTEEFRVYDPATYPRRADPRRVLLIDAGHDYCMPQWTRDALWEALGRPERYTIRYGHGSSFLTMMPIGFNVTGRRITRYLLEHLLPESTTED